MNLTSVLNLILGRIVDFIEYLATELNDNDQNNKHNIIVYHLQYLDSPGRCHFVSTLHTQLCFHAYFPKLHPRKSLLVLN